MEDRSDNKNIADRVKKGFELIMVTNNDIKKAVLLITSNQREINGEDKRSADKKGS